mmetsp:Transcript_16301/g.48887  ORF Transcript_16301/g.48887 Transcript_16301/m.48887 type:complete len:247 (+) Transcript_16301:497-1237(+)
MSILTQSLKAAEDHLPKSFRFLEALFAIQRPGEMVFGIGLLYWFRAIERRMSSGRFAAQVLLVTGISAAIKHLLRIFGWQWAHWTPGPTPLVTSYVVPFALYFPPLQQFEFLHFKLNDKVFTYLAVIQLLLWAPRLSLPAGLAGLTAGLLYHTNLGGMQHFSVPKRALALVGALEQQPSVSYAAISQTQQPNQRTQFPEQVRPAVQVSHTAVSALVAMGFSQQDAETALLQVGGENVQAAIDQLSS